MTASVSLVLDFPPPEVEPNSRKHWAVKARAVTGYKQACWVDALIAKDANKGIVWPLQAPVVAEITFVVRNIKRDVDNCLASFKAGLDGIVLAGLIKDDNSKVLKVVPSVIFGRKQEVRVTLTSEAEV